MPSSVASLSAIPLALVPFMISFPASGMMPQTTSPPKTASLKGRPLRGKRKAIRLPAILPAWLPIFFLYSNAGSSNRIILFPSSSVFISSSSWTFPSVRGWSTRNIWLLPATVLLYAALLNSEKSGSVNVRNSCSCKRHYSQPDCNWGWDSHRECYFFGYHLYMYVASDSHSDLPIFPLLERASRHDMLSFLHSFFTMKAYLPEFSIEKLLLDSAHDAYAVYQYCRRENITPFIDLNPGHTGHFTYKDDFSIDNDGVPLCKLGLRMHKDGYEAAKHRAKYRCPKSNRKRGCFCGHPCSPAKYGRTVHIFTDDNPRLFNIPPRDSKAWEKEYDGRTSVERSNKREKEDYKLEDGRHRSTKMWYCRLYGIMMLQHLDAWEMPSVPAFQDSLLGLPA